VQWICRETFYFRLEGLDWNSFIEDYVTVPTPSTLLPAISSHNIHTSILQGTRKYVLKQSPASLPACRWDAPPVFPRSAENVNSWLGPKMGDYAHTMEISTP
jgi:hypothetical protein